MSHRTTQSGFAISPVPVILFLVALLVAGMAGLLVKSYLDKTPLGTMNQANMPPMVDVLVASKEIETGTTLKKSNLEWQNWPEINIEGLDLITKPVDDQNLEPEVLGKIARSRILKYEPLTLDKVFDRDKAGFLAGLIDPGMRAVSIEVKEWQSLTGLLLPGDRVDVIVTVRARDLNDIDNLEGVGVPSYITETILADIKVLASDRTAAAEDEDSLEPPEVVTIEVTPEGAQIVAIAQRMGDIMLILRSAIRFEDDPTDISTEQNATPNKAHDLIMAMRRARLSDLPESKSFTTDQYVLDDAIDDLHRRFMPDANTVMPTPSETNDTADPIMTEVKIYRADQSSVVQFEE
ncbi:MAG: Flp pilus assembly protein CpaB [Pseudomonadota bacterium]|nr:Flp pilus assembly protein CpaB [Pseudomonadota bacterium]